MGMSEERRPRYRDERERREQKDGITRRDFLDGAAMSAAGLAAAAAFPGLSGAEAMTKVAEGDRDRPRRPDRERRTGRQVGGARRGDAGARPRGDGGAGVAPRRGRGGRRGRKRLARAQPRVVFSLGPIEDGETWTVPDVPWACHSVGLWPPVQDLDPGQLAWVDGLAEAIAPHAVDGTYPSCRAIPAA
jgi:hypothetical protein